MYSTNLTKIIDDIFSFPYVSLDASYAYDSVKSNKEDTKITVIVPGFAKEDLQLNVNDNYLTLSSKLEDKKLNRTWKLAESADIKNIQAECKNGILTLTIPVKHRLDKTRTIEIK